MAFYRLRLRLLARGPLGFRRSHSLRLWKPSANCAYLAIIGEKNILCTSVCPRVSVGLKAVDVNRGTVPASNPVFAWQQEGVVCYCSNWHSAHPSLYVRAPVHCAQPPKREKNPMSRHSWRWQGVFSLNAWLFKHFSAPCLKRKHFLLLFLREREMLTLFTSFIVYITSFLNERTIARCFLWALRSPVFH